MHFACFPSFQTLEEYWFCIRAHALIRINAASSTLSRRSAGADTAKGHRWHCLHGTRWARRGWRVDLTDGARTGWFRRAVERIRGSLVSKYPFHWNPNVLSCGVWDSMQTQHSTWLYRSIFVVGGKRSCFFFQSHPLCTAQFKLHFFPSHFIPRWFDVFCVFRILWIDLFQCFIFFFFSGLVNGSILGCSRAHKCTICNNTQLLVKHLKPFQMRLSYAGPSKGTDVLSWWFFFLLYSSKNMDYYTVHTCEWVAIIKRIIEGRWLAASTFQHWEMNGDQLDALVICIMDKMVQDLSLPTSWIIAEEAALNAHSNLEGFSASRLSRRGVKSPFVLFMLIAIYWARRH